MKKSFSEQNIIKEVNKICNNTEFQSKSLLCRFLSFVVKESLAGRGDLLKGYTIGVEVFGKAKDFDPEQDSLVRIHAGRLRRLLKLYYLDQGKNDPVIINIPKGGYQPQFLPGKGGNGTLISDADKEKHVLPLLEPTVVVLPFKNLTGNPEKDFFAQGFSEELSIELTKYEDLKVINCWHRPESDVSDNMEFVNRYRVRFLIDGGIMIQDQRIKILVKLMDITSGNLIWAEGYNRDLSMESLIEIEENVSKSIAKIIGSEMGIIFHQLTEEFKRMKTDELDVFYAMLRYYYFEAHQSQELMFKTFEILKKTHEKNPHSGIIYAMLASLYGNMYALNAQNSEEAFRKMGELADKALALDPNHQLVRVIYVYMCFIFNDKERFLNEVNHCLALNLNSPARLGAIGFYLSLSGEWERGKSILKEAMNENIGYPLFFHGATSLYEYRRQEYEKALDEAFKYDIPGLFWAPMLRAACLGQLKRSEEALNQIRHLENLKPDFEEKAYYLISRFVKEDDLVEQVIEGLKKAGLKIENRAFEK